MRSRALLPCPRSLARHSRRVWSLRRPQLWPPACDPRSLLTAAALAARHSWPSYRSVFTRSPPLINATSPASAAPAKPSLSALEHTARGHPGMQHHKVSAAMEARYVKGATEQMMGGRSDVFLDSDNLNDLQKLMSHVRDSEVLVLFQTREVLLRPFCILEGISS